MTARGSAKTPANPTPKPASSFAHTYATYAVLIGTGTTATPATTSGSTPPPTTGQIWPRTAV